MSRRKPPRSRKRPCGPTTGGRRPRSRRRRTTSATASGCASARTQGLAALPDYELLELFLFRSLPQGDVKPLAKALLDRFGGLAGVLGADLGGAEDASRASARRWRST